ncbi:hypothetical protein D4Q80_03015 [bacterium]|nr:MAG: hypothetical protein D4Q80_03015 [bacterium]
MYIPIWLFVLTAFVLFVFYKNKQKQEEFSPVRISIQPKWDELFKDYNIADDNSWDSKVTEEKEYNVLREGINFTILKPDLIYDNDWHSFKTTVDFRRKIDEVSPNKYGTDFIGVYINSGIEGYELGIRTPESHEKSFKEKQQYKGYFGDDSDLIKIATIPYSEFLFPWYVMQSKKKKEKIDKNLKKFEWTRQAPDAELSRVDSSVALEHRYFSVYYEHI